MPEDTKFDCASLAAFLAREVAGASDVGDIPDGRVEVNDGESPRYTGFSFEVLGDGRVLVVQVTELRGPRT